MKNFITRAITSVFVVVALAGSIVLRQLVDYRLMYVLLYLFAVLGTFEMIRAMGDRLTSLQKCIAVAFSLSVTPAFCFLGGTSVAIITACAAILTLLTLVFDFQNTTIDSCGFTFITLTYPTGLLIPTLLANEIVPYGFIAMVLTFAIAPFADSGAYIIGSLLKGPKLCPTISPKKTVSGAIGGLLGGALASILVWVIFAKGQIFNSVTLEAIFFIILGVLGAIVTIIGDLIEGAIKRKLGIKDMGNLLPGHGGVLDRIDSTILCGAFIYLAFAFIN